MTTPLSFPPVLVNRDRLRHEDLAFEIGCYWDEMIRRGHYLPSELHPYVEAMHGLALFMYSYTHQVGSNAIWEATKTLEAFDNVVAALEELKLAECARDLRDFRPDWIAHKDHWWDLPKFGEFANRALRRFPDRLELQRALDAWAQGHPEIIYLPEADYERELGDLVQLDDARTDRRYTRWIETSLADQPRSKHQMARMVYQVVSAKLVPPVRLKDHVVLKSVPNVHGREVRVWAFSTDSGRVLHGVKMSEGLTITAQMDIDISTPKARSAFVAGSLTQVDTHAVVALLERPPDRLELECAVSLIRQAGLTSPVTITPYLDDPSKQDGHEKVRSFLIFLEDRTAVIMRLSPDGAALFNEAIDTVPVVELSLGR